MERYGYIASVCIVACFLSVSALCSEQTSHSRSQFPVDSTQKPIPPEICSKSSRTILEMGGLSHSMHMDGNEGGIHAVIKDKATGKIIWKDEFIGRGVCFGFNDKTKEHVIGLIRQDGAVLLLSGLVFINEDKPIRSEVLEIGQAFAAQMALDGKFLVFIGNYQDKGLGLFVVNMETRAIKRLGDAPMPPPLSKDENRDEPREMWGWGMMWRDNYMDMDPGIISIDGQGILKVSYGNDTAELRSKKRKIETWDLYKVFSDGKSDTQVIFRALLKISESKVPKEGLHCEINSPADVMVGDFLSQYLTFSIDKPKNGKASFSCSDSDDGKCTLTIAYMPSDEHEGNSYHLRFLYNPKLKSIDPKTLECVQVP